jgi:hypothetical protein
MSAVAEPVALPQPIVVAQPVAVPTPPAPAPKVKRAERDLWVIPFAVTLAGSLALFAEQIAQYTSLL